MGTKQFGVVTRDIYDDPNLTTYDIALYGALCSRWNRKTKEPIYAMIETLAADIKSSGRTITRCLKNLSATGWISVKYRHNASNLITLERYHGMTHSHPDMTESHPKEIRHDSQSGRHDSQSPPGMTERPSNKTIKQDSLTRPKNAKQVREKKPPKSKDQMISDLKDPDLSAYSRNAGGVHKLWLDTYNCTAEHPTRKLSADERGQTTNIWTDALISARDDPEQAIQLVKRAIKQAWVDHKQQDRWRAKEPPTPAGVHRHWNTLIAGTPAKPKRRIPKRPSFKTRAGMTGHELEQQKADVREWDDKYGDLEPGTYEEYEVEH